MLHVTDINTSSDDLEEIEHLKTDFREKLEPTVKHGSVIFLSNLPAVDNLSGKIDLVIFLSIDSLGYGNYLRVQQENKLCYISNFIFIIKRIFEFEIDKIDREFIYSKETRFDYAEANRLYNSQFEDYLQPYGRIRSFSLFQIKTNSDISYCGMNAVVNNSLSAELILKSAIIQSQYKFGDQKVSSFSFSQSKLINNDYLSDFVARIIEDCNDKSKIGILTKKKLDLITTSTKTVDKIFNNIGNSLSIISGKAGTGKTLTLIRIIHKQASNNHNLRFLTYNNLLVFDIKQNLRQFGYYGDNRIAIGTIHSFYYKLSKKLGIPTILSQTRINELMNTCEHRIEKTRTTFERLKSFPDKITNQKYFLDELIKTKSNIIDIDEFKEFSKFVSSYKNLSSFEEVKREYLNCKRSILVPNIGNQIFLEDYYKVLELIYLAITDSKKFYEDLKIRDHYDLLSTLYKTDKFTEEKGSESSEDNIIPYENLVDQIKTLKQTSNWSRLLIVDECQDFHILEKEILYKIRGSANMIVATGGKHQLIRHSNELNWGVSLNQRLILEKFPLQNGSFRQKQNIIEFVNKFSNEYGLRFDLSSIAESKGLGKVIIDLRPKQHIINDDILEELRSNGKVNGCSLYESLMILIPSRNYTSKNVGNGFVVNEKDYLTKTNISTDRHLMNSEFFANLDVHIWDGVNENKGKLRIPNQNELRIIHYESCRGLESWSSALMSLDEYFHFKRSSKEAGNHLSDDLFLSEEDRRDKYAALWCLMAFTRSIDTLYIHFEKQDDPFTKKVLDIASTCEGITINRTNPV